MGRIKGVTIDHLIEAAGLRAAGAEHRHGASRPSGTRATLTRGAGAYGAYLRFIKQKGAEIYYNTTMALPYQIDPEQIDDALERWNCRPPESSDRRGHFLVY